MGEVKKVTLDDAWKSIRELAEVQKETNYIAKLTKSQEETKLQLKEAAK